MAEGKYIVLSQVNSSNDYQQLITEDAKNVARSYDMDLVPVYAESQLMTQIKQIYEYINREATGRPFAILAHPVEDNSLSRVAGDAARMGIPWISLNRNIKYLEGLRSEFPQLICFSVTPDHIEIGRIQGRQCEALLPEGGKTLYVQGRFTTSSSQGRLKGMREILEGSKVEIVNMLDGSWTAIDAERVVSGWLRMAMVGRFNLDLVCCQNDMMATGAKKSLLSAADLLNKPDIANIPVLGIDGVPSFGQRLVSQGELLATIVMPSTSGPAIKALMNAIKTGKQPPQEIVLESRSFPDEAVLRSNPLKKK